MTENAKKRMLTENGKTYFSKAAERKVFFVLTIIMLVVGVLAKFGLF